MKNTPWWPHVKKPVVNVSLTLLENLPFKRAESELLKATVDCPHGTDVRQIAVKPIAFHALADIQAFLLDARYTYYIQNLTLEQIPTGQQIYVLRVAKADRATPSKKDR